jgi:hypothetical protein
MIETAKQIAESVTGFFNEEEENGEIEATDTTASKIRDRMPDMSSLSHRSHPNSSPGSKELTPGRAKNLREDGWDGVKGTHREVKYRKLEQLEQRREEAQRQAEKHAGSNKPRSKKFLQLAKQLEERIARQKAKIAALEG